MPEQSDSEVMEKDGADKSAQLESVDDDKREYLEQETKVASEPNEEGSLREHVTLQVDRSKHQNGKSTTGDTQPSDEQVVDSLKSSLKSTPHSVVEKKHLKADENKGAGWKLWLPIICFITIFLIVILVVSIIYSPKSTEGK